MKRAVWFGLAVGGMWACTVADGRPAVDRARSDSIARAREDSINRPHPGYVVDSVLPVEEELRRFRAAVGGTTVTSLAHASASRDALVRRVVRALASNDAADLRAIALDAREFADLVYPGSPFTRPPYRQSPEVVWMQLQTSSSSGLVRLLRRVGGRPWRYVDHSCDPRPDRQGPNSIWTSCVVRMIGPRGDTIAGRLFGSIVERERRFKVMSYKNQF